METSNVLILFVTSFVGCVSVLAVLVSTWLVVREGLRMMRKAQRKRRRAEYNAYYNIPAKGIAPTQKDVPVTAMSLTQPVVLVDPVTASDPTSVSLDEDTLQAA